MVMLSLGINLNWLSVIIRKNKWVLIALLTNASLVQAKTCLDSSLTPDDRYIIENSIAIDKQTGLMWKRCPEGMNWNGSTCVGEAIFVTWKTATNFYKTSGSEWRLPTKDELVTLFSFTDEKYRKDDCREVAINQNVFPNQDFSFWYMSSSPYISKDGNKDNLGAWGVHFSFEREFLSGKKSFGYVRLVHSKVD